MAHSGAWREIGKLSIFQHMALLLAGVCCVGGGGEDGGEALEAVTEVVLDS